MVSLKKVLVGAVVAVTYVISGEAVFIDFAKARTTVLNTVERLVKRTEPPPKFIEPRDNTDRLRGGKMVKINEIDPKLASDRRIHNCQTWKLGSGPTGNWANYNEHCHHPFVHNSTVDPVDREIIIKNLNEQRSNGIPKGAFITRGEIVHSTRELVQGYREPTVEWGVNPGHGKIEVDSACKLCTSVNDHYILGKGYIKSDGSHQCNCRKWAHGENKFMICNCDLCDALKVEFNISRDLPEHVREDVQDGISELVRDTGQSKRFLSSVQRQGRKRKSYRSFDVGSSKRTVSM